MVYERLNLCCYSLSNHIFGLCFELPPQGLALHRCNQSILYRNLIHEHYLLVHCFIIILLHKQANDDLRVVPPPIYSRQEGQKKVQNFYLLMKNLQQRHSSKMM